MNRLFIRVFGGLLLALVVVGLVCSFLYSTINVVRSEHHKATISSPVFDWLSIQDTSSLTSLVNQLSLSDLSDMGVVRVDLEVLNTLHLSSVELARLKYGQSVVTEQVNGYRVIRLLPPEEGGQRAIVAWFPDFYAGVEQLAGKLVVDQLNAIDFTLLTSDQVDVRLSALADAFFVDIQPVRDTQSLGPKALEQLADAGRYFYPGSTEKSAEGYYRLQDGSIHRLVFSDPFKAISWPLVMALGALALAGIAAAVFILISSIDRRLRSLETVASRIARGELDARIEVDRQDAIGRLGNAFNSMGEHIQRLVAVQREMIHAVSHELRTPVARIRFGVQMIEDCTSETALHKQLTGIDSDIQELDELIDEILTYARLEQGGPILSVQDVDVKAIVQQVVSEQGSVKPGMVIEATFEEGSENWKQSDVEYRYIHRAVQNLVGNATRYASSTVKVRCAFDKDTCRIDVEDDGSGIPEEDWDKVFTPFARLDDSRTRSSGGYGLGLSIVRRILYWHGGQAFLGRSAMGGAKFSLVWPRRQVIDDLA